MNAYELADELENKINLSENLFVFDAANMLRQQADRIAELEKQTKPLSEKELYEVFDKCYPNNGDGDVVTLVDFARAIEERHGIK